jgi:hypothetical protein
MKYIIKENRMIDIIKLVLNKRYPNITDINIRTKNVKLGSFSEKHKMGEVIEVSVIEVSIDNTDKKLSYSDFRDLYSQIKFDFNTLLNIDVEEYGSKYVLEIYALEKVKKIG